MKRLEATEQHAKKLEEKRDGSTFRIQDINKRNQQLQQQVAATASAREQAALMSGEMRAHDPFARIQTSHVSYYSVKSASAEAEAEAEAAEAGAEATAEAAEGAGLTVDVDGAAAGEDAQISPGAALLETPHGDGPPPDGELPEAKAVDSALAGFGSERGSGRSHKSKQLPALAGKRAEAHNVDLDLDLEIDAAGGGLARGRAAFAKPQQPAAAPARGGDGSAEPARNKLSLADYRRRMMTS